ncbi:transglutaminase family protein [Alicyclobacillus vulcanalis]|uniref:Transglutaminase-like superfamily protein n=1 Tax=Alicyclobacillus vulcanalis TaxID=252246 RepID=A0A1N7P5U9_9BACL|nr:transglutaminase domain-containing protein [Alicyclobacillus vulcanalis]SIT05928.1 Transglutaminase-like superfamily protein [Alicyclobacillus vulcanalis]
MALRSLGRLVPRVLCCAWVMIALAPVGYAVASHWALEVGAFWLAVCLGAMLKNAWVRGAVWAVLIAGQAALGAWLSAAFRGTMTAGAGEWRFYALSAAGLAAMALVRYAYRRPVTWLVYNGVAQLGLVAVSLTRPVAGVCLELMCVAIMLALFAVSRSGRAPCAPLERRIAAGVGAGVVVSGALCALIPPQNPLVPGVSRIASLLVPKVPARTGYSLDDSHLGGSLVTDPQPILEVRAPAPLDLRGQVLADYTGQGWLSVPLDGSDVATAAIGQVLPGGLPFSHLAYRTMDVTVSVKGDVNTSDLIAPYAVRRVLRLPGLYGNDFAIDRVQGNIKAAPLGPGASYEVEAAVPVDPYASLAAVRMPFAAARRAIPRDVQIIDTQLPAELPARVRQLALQIVSARHAATEYGMVSAIIAYLAGHERYDVSNIPAPAPGQDYVAQFLFETHRGYCDNFASAAAVMLRALGVPARFVTGFAVGPENEVAPDTYVVSEADAHAWIEVYFPGFGWVPFDATPGFRMTFAAAPVKPSPIASSHPGARRGALAGSHVSHRPFGVEDLGLAVAGCAAASLALAAVVRRRRCRVWQGEQEAFVRLVGQAKARLGLSPGATLRDLRPLAASAGAEGAFDAWLRAAEAKLYGSSPEPSPDWRDLAAPLARWLDAAPTKEVQAKR